MKETGVRVVDRVIISSAGEREDVQRRGVNGNRKGRLREDRLIRGRGGRVVWVERGKGRCE